MYVYQSVFYLSKRQKMEMNFTDPKQYETFFGGMLQAMPRQYSARPPDPVMLTEIPNNKDAISLLMETISLTEAFKLDRELHSFLTDYTIWLSIIHDGWKEYLGTIIKSSAPNASVFISVLDHGARFYHYTMQNRVAYMRRLQPKFLYIKIAAERAQQIVEDKIGFYGDPESDVENEEDHAEDLATFTQVSRRIAEGKRDLRLQLVAHLRSLAYTAARLNERALFGKQELRAIKRAVEPLIDRALPHVPLPDPYVDHAARINLPEERRTAV